MEGKGDSKQSDRQRQGEVALTEHFSKRLTAYATAAGAACVGVLALAPPADANIIVNKNPISIGVNSTVPFEINGVTQFTFSDFLHSATLGGFVSISEYLKITPGMGHVVVSHTFNRFVTRLAKGAGIGPGRSFGQEEAVMARLFNPEGSFIIAGEWANSTYTRNSGYIGFEFLSHGNTHFGWAHAQVTALPFGGITADINEYAYNTIPDQSIRAGQTSASEPAPATLLLLALGSLGLGFWRRKKQQPVTVSDN
jgi:hypothetical protein